MNRAERRRSTRQESKDPILQIRSSDVERIKEETQRKAADEVFIKLLGLPIMAMHDKHGWGKKRLEQLTEDILELNDSLGKGLFTMEDIEKVLFEECGIKVTRSA